MISTAKAIKKTREAQGMTQKELAERCGYTVTDIKAYELGEKEPKHINLMTIAGALGVTMYEMFERKFRECKRRSRGLICFFFFCLFIEFFPSFWIHFLKPFKKISKQSVFCFFSNCGCIFYVVVSS